MAQATGGRQHQVMNDISSIRKDYVTQGLSRDCIDLDPIVQFENWFREACDSNIPEPNAMSLATVTPSAAPALRTVLLKYFDGDGFVFFTNYSSNKSTQIEANSNVSLLFHWRELMRQVIICGTAERISTAESVKYFVTRPRGSQLGAWCSRQSSVISARSLLDEKLNELKEKFRNREIPIPSFWGGYRVTPMSIEFWQGRANRLHDRFLFTCAEAGKKWTIDRLAP